MEQKIYDAVVIGTGAAGYSAADWLYQYGIKDIAIVSENRFSGTSRNTGSDKQTYYKLSLDGLNADCAYNMARDIAAGGSCDGEAAYIEAVNSPRCFYRLMEYGVDFPSDKFGAYPGYITDHDSAGRATSIGPLTSKVMTEKLESRALIYDKIPLIDGNQVVSLLVRNGECFGVLTLERSSGKIQKILAANVVAATGAPACVYHESVYPESQHGMTGALINAGVKLCNFGEWQYGIASTDFRWNVSGSFLQVMPRVVSVGSDGVEKEFLTEHYSTAAEMCSELFLKGYQWPFSADRINGSSKIDILVYNEIEKGRSVFLDFTKNPSDFCFEALNDTAKDYLTAAGAVGETPIERLKKLNCKAISLYKTHGINLNSEYLKISVCAQHNNGGAYVDNNYQTNIKNLYVIGEAAGVFGLTRPGGTALNSTQVGGLVAAKSIAKSDRADFSQEIVAFAESEKEKYQQIVDIIDIGNDKTVSEIPVEMSRCAAFKRKAEDCESLFCKVKKLLNSSFRAQTASEYFYNNDMLVCADALLTTILGTMNVTGSRGGALFIKNGDVLEENLKYRNFLTITHGQDVSFYPTREVPRQKTVFETLL
jgi:succinate dehydrogenase/fumarate reductase flavoprotein subunit